MNQGVRKALENLVPGRHIITLYNSETHRMELMANFLSQGICRGEQCVFAGGELGKESFSLLGRRLPDLDAHIRRGRIIFLPLRMDGSSTSQENIEESIRQLAGKARKEGYGGLVLVAEMSGILDAFPHTDAFLGRLDILDNLMINVRATMLSQFREDLFTPKLIYHVLSKYPVVVIGDEVYGNGYNNQTDRVKPHPALFPLISPSTSILKGSDMGHTQIDKGFPRGWTTLLDEFPDPLMIGDGQRQMANKRLRALAQEASAVGLDLGSQLSGLWLGAEESLQISLSLNRSFSFCRVRFDNEPTLIMLLGREIVSSPLMDPGLSRRAYDELLDAMPLGFVTIDREGNIIAANGAAIALLGLPMEKILRLSYLEAIHPFDRSKAAQWLASLERTSEVLEMRLAGTRGECWITVRSVPSPDPGLRGILWEDINDRKRSEVLQLLNEELMLLQDHLQYLSTRDAMTGLFNRQYFEEEIRRLRNPRFGPVSIIMIDVDGLKPVNDQFGHPIGDELLQTAARVLKSPFRETDMVARIGGDEFAVLLPQTTYEMARRRRDEILQEVNRHNQTSAGPVLSLSVGVATSLTEGHSLEDTIKRADDDMYRFKLAHTGGIPIDDKEILVTGSSLPAGRRDAPVQALS